MHAEIALDVPLHTLFTYRIPDALKEQIQPGIRVVVPFRRHQMIGVCLKIKTDSDTAPILNKKGKQTQIKAIKDILPDIAGAQLLDANYLTWLAFAADYYMIPIGQVLAQAIPAYYFDVKKQTTPSKEPRSRNIRFNTRFKTKSVTLTTEQANITKEISAHFDQYYPTLLHGITGSGKTEIYIELIKKALDQNHSALFLVPEIGLTPQMLARLNHHFKGRLLVYHSGLTKNQRLHQWNQCLETEPKVMVGTRSALFAPFKNLGLIIVDEEHDTSYKQEDRFRYHARDLAVMRAHRLKIPIILGSATPSLESYYLAQNKKYHYAPLTSRIGDSKLPEIKVIPFKKEKEQTGVHLLVSQNIHQAIEHHYKKREQMLIFVGQRGYAQNAYCDDCAQIQLCLNCNIGLKYHKGSHDLKCHYCDYTQHFDEICQSCKKKTLTLLGFGTQSIEEEIQTMHPQLIIRRIDSDVINTPKQLDEVLSEFAEQKINLIIGTQMISKGHDFSNIGFVGVLGIDAHLGLPEFRANERTFQNLVQVAGRAGRADKKGRVLIQSLVPDHPAILAGIDQDYKKFADHELKLRKELNYPPYSRLVQWRFTCNQEAQLKNFMSQWSLFLNGLRKKTSEPDLIILGPAEMPISKIRGKFRYHCIFKIRRGLKSQELLQYVWDDLERRQLQGIQYQIDVDAMGLI